MLNPLPLRNTLAAAYLYAGLSGPTTFPLTTANNPTARENILHLFTQLINSQTLQCPNSTETALGLIYLGEKYVMTGQYL
jgi:hypothetical protein